MMSLWKRYVFLAFGLLVMAFGVAFSIKAALGTSPISSVPYVISLFTPLTVGVITIIMHVVFILAQILLLRRNYELIQLMQLPVALFFGVMTDVALIVIAGINPVSYIQQCAYCALGIVLVGFGVAVEVTADVVMLAAEGLITAITKVFPIKFTRMKVTFDVTLVVTATILSFVFIGSLNGVREGTIAAALLVGPVARVFTSIFEKMGLTKRS